MLPFITQGAGFGFAAGTTFGALHSLLLNITLTRGWRYGLLIVLTPLLTDAPIILLMLLVLRQLPPSAAQLLRLIGGIVVLWLAWSAWRQYRQPSTVAVTPASEVNVTRQTLFKGIVVNFLNPAPYIFWGTFMGTILLEGLAQSVWHGIAFLAAFYGTFLVIMVVLVMVFDRLRTLDPRVTRWLSLLTVIVMTLLGLQLLWQGLTGKTGL